MPTSSLDQQCCRYDHSYTPPPAVNAAAPIEPLALVQDAVNLLGECTGTCVQLRWRRKVEVSVRGSFQCFDFRQPELRFTATPGAQYNTMQCTMQQRYNTIQQRCKYNTMQCTMQRLIHSGAAPDVPLVPGPREPVCNHSASTSSRQSVTRSSAAVGRLSHWSQEHKPL